MNFVRTPARQIASRANRARHLELAAQSSLDNLACQIPARRALAGPAKTDSTKTPPRGTPHTSRPLGRPAARNSLRSLYPCASGNTSPSRGRSPATSRNLRLRHPKKNPRRTRENPGRTHPQPTRTHRNPPPGALPPAPTFPPVCYPEISLPFSLDSHLESRFRQSGLSEKPCRYRGHDGAVGRPRP